MKAESIFEPLNKLREKLGDQFITNEKGQNVDISASFGLVEYPDNTDTAKGLLEKAEEALKHSKDAGRNSITIYSAEQQADPASEYRYLLEN